MYISIPKLKIDYDFKSKNSRGELSVQCIVGLGIHWAWVYLATIVTPQIFFPTAQDVTVLNSSFYATSVITLALTLGFAALLSDRLSVLAERQTTPFLVSVFSVLGTVLLLFANGSLGVVACIAAGILTGIGSGCLLLLWGIAFGKLNVPSIVLNASLAVIVAFVMYVLVAGLLPRHVALIITILAPMIEAVVLFLQQKQLRQSASMAKTRLRVKKGIFALKIGFPSLVFGISLGVLREMSVTSTFSTVGTPQQLILLIGALFAAALVCCSTLFFKRYEQGFLFRPFVPCIAVVLVLLSSMGEVNEIVLALMVLVGYICFEIIMWTAFAEITSRYGLSALLVFGFGRAALAIGTFIGVIGSKTVAVTSILPMSEVSEPSILMFTLLVAYCLLPREKSILKMILRNEKDIALCDDSVNLNTKCEIIAKRYLLSSREAEVFYLLAKGRNTAHISEAFIISSNTAKTHIKRIYQKTDVHTQQELIDMVETADVLEG